MRSILFLFVWSLASVALACTAFRMPVGGVAGSGAGVARDVVVGRNFDWDYGHGLMVVNKRGVSKRALMMHPSDTATWTSRFGSLTFNQAGRELPYGGMNEKGLMLEVLWLGWTSWPKTTAPSMNEVQWIQYQLDMRGSIAELVAGLDDVRILPIFAKVHFFACDATGECATIEGLGSRLNVHRGFDVNALTNDPYSSSVQYLSSLASCPVAAHTDGGSLDRFARASCLASVGSTAVPVGGEAAAASSYLDLVDQGDYTKWKIVYDLTRRTISLRTHDASVAKTVSLDAFDFSCATPVRVFEMNSALSGDVSASFVDYSVAANRSIVEKSVLNGFAHLPAPVVEKIVEFPDTTTCSVR